MEPENRGGPDQPTSLPPNSRDGRLDFSRYSLEQLQDLLQSFDPETFPLNFSNLRAEIERRSRQSLSQERCCSGGQWSVRFTRNEGLRGWLQAQYRRLALYGTGTLEITPEQLCIKGWQRTWLAAPARTELSIPIAAIDGVAREDALIRIETIGSGWRRRRIELIAPDTETAAAIASRSPAVRSHRFQRRYVERREFERQLRRATPRVWVTPALVAINCAVFGALLLSQHSLGAIELTRLLAWGANLGSFTVNGQWWRLLTELFLHLSLLHLAVNMWVLWNIGRLTERLYGPALFLGLYLACGCLSGLGSIVWNPSLATLGASGAIFALFGAFFAYLLQHRREVPWSIARAHWLSTAAFVLFNLLAGMMQQGIDNAAHVTGLVSGFGLGWILARPIARVQGRVAALQLLAAAAVVVASILFGSWQVLGLGSSRAPSEEYYRQHRWMTDESSNVRLWLGLAVRLQSGQISTAELTASFKRDIVPFWEQAAARLKEERGLPLREQAYAALMLDYVNHRLAWARAIAALTGIDDQSQLQPVLRLAGETDLLQARIERIGLRVAAEHRSRGWVDSEAMIRLRNWFAPPQGGCVRAPPVMRRPLAPTDQQADSPALSDATACAAQRALVQRQFRLLDRMMDQYRNSLEDLPDGNSRFSAVVTGIDDLFTYGPLTVNEALAALALWRRTRPESVNPDLIEAMAFEDWAWSARGHGTVDTVSAQSMTLFRHRSEMAAAALEDTATRAQSSPLWYTLSLKVGLDRSNSAQQLRTLLDRGAARFPRYWPLYGAMLRALMPRWGGSYQQVDEFIRAVDKKLDADSQAYARLYWIYSGLEGDEVDIFTDSKIEWQRMEQGFQALLQRYPHSDYLLNGWAYLACRAHDAAAYRSVRLAVQAHYSASAWTEKYSLSKCDKSIPSAAGASALDASVLPLGAPLAVTTAKELAVWADLTRAWKQEQQLVNQANQLDQQFGEQKISWAEWSHRISTQITPAWEEIKDRLVDEDLPRDSRLEPLRQALLNYGDEVNMAFSLATEAARSGNAGTGQWASDVMGNTRQAAAEVAERARQLGVALPP